MRRIIDFAKSMDINIKNIRSFANLVFEEERLRYKGSSEIKLCVYVFGSHVNGYVRTINVGSRRYARVVLNGFPFLQDKEHRNPTLTWYYIYATIVHELEHIRVAQLLEDNDSPVSFQTFMAGLCQHNRHSSTDWIRGISNYSFVPNYVKNKRRTTSLPELICTQNGLHRAYEVMGRLLRERDRIIVETTMHSVDFLCDHIEITYERSAQPFNLFARNLLKIRNRIMRDRRCLDQMPQLKVIVDENGNLHSPLAWFNSMSETNRTFYHELLIRVFLFLNMNWEQYFAENKEFFDYMETLANEYCKRTVFYLKNMHMGEIFFEQDILQDNAAMLIKNTAWLNVLMDRFQMKHTYGSVVSMF